MLAVQRRNQSKNLQREVKPMVFDQKFQVFIFQISFRKIKLHLNS